MSSKSICGGQQWSVSVSDVFFLPSDFFTDWAIYKICKVFNVEYFDAACWYLFKHTFEPDTYAFLWTDNLFFSISPFLPVIWFLSLCSVKFLYFVCHFCCFFFFFGRLKLGTYGLATKWIFGGRFQKLWNWQIFNPKKNSTHQNKGAGQEISQKISHGTTSV